MLQEIKKDFAKLTNKQKAKLLSRFFKTGRGEYGEGDIFLGIVVPKQRELARKYDSLSLNDIQTLLSSNIHEYRLTSLFILISKYQKTDENEKRKIVDFYLKNTKNINNWDLIDLSAPSILGDHLTNKDKKILYKLARSKNLWEKRIAILSTFYFIRQNSFKDTLKISEILLEDRHDLIHKAVGWMLREVGKRNQKAEEQFLLKHYKKMPRTMLRYAIERFSDKKRQFFLKSKSSLNGTP